MQGLKRRLVLHLLSSIGIKVVIEGYLLLSTFLELGVDLRIELILGRVNVVHLFSELNNGLHDALDHTLLLPTLILAIFRNSINFLGLSKEFLDSLGRERISFPWFLSLL